VKRFVNAGMALGCWRSETTEPKYKYVLVQDSPAGLMGIKSSSAEVASAS
jgi:hypothetical protein